MRNYLPPLDAQIQNLNHTFDCRSNDLMAAIRGMDASEEAVRLFADRDRFATAGERELHIQRRAAERRIQLRW